MKSSDDKNHTKNIKFQEGGIRIQNKKDKIKKKFNFWQK